MLVVSRTYQNHDFEFTLLDLVATHAFQLKLQRGKECGQQIENLPMGRRLGRSGNSELTEGESIHAPDDTYVLSFVKN